MRILIPGLKAWPYHHEVEHLLAEALRAAGHEVAFLGCSRPGMEACECVDRAVNEAAGGHAAFCARCIVRQGGVHRRAGFRELPIPHDATLRQGIAMRLERLDADGVLALPLCGTTLGEVAGPSLRRWARSGRDPRGTVPLEVLKEHAAHALGLEALLPELLRRERTEMLLVLNGLFLSERVATLVARGAGIRVVNYERGHARNSFVFSARQPACWMEPDWELPAPRDDDPLATRYLAGRAHNRDANTRFGTGTDGGVAAGGGAVLVLTNVCWDSAVCSRPDGFGGYLEWLGTVLEEARRRPERPFILRIHPGEERLAHDPTLDRTEAWLAERGLPANVSVVGAGEAVSSYQLMAECAAGVVYSTSAGLEMAGMGKPVLVCGPAHYSGRGFTREAARPETLGKALDAALAEGEDPVRGRMARSYAGRLFLDGAVPFPWVDEVEYGRPQRVAPRVDAAWLARDPLLSRLVDWLAGGAERPFTLRELVEQPSLCPLPFHFGSRLADGPTRLAVLIPAHQRPATLLRCLEGWLGQERPDLALRILVVDDGSQPPLGDAVASFLAGRGGASGAKLDVLRLEENGGPARARNRGLDLLLAEGGHQRILITGDDMLPEPGYLARLAAEHVAWGDPRVAILGRVDWDPGQGINRVMRLVERNGMQFGYSALPARAWLPAQYAYTCALALDAGFLQGTGLRFAEDFPHAAWEDVEFGVRALEQGMVLVHDAAQRLRHDHPTDYASFARRQRKAGVCSRVFQARRPREHAAICGSPPEDPPDRLVVRALEQALAELGKLSLPALSMLPGMPGPAGPRDLAAQLDHEQDRLLETLFRLHADAGWFERPDLPAGPGRQGLLSVLIPVHNQWALTRACLDALSRNTAGPFEVVLVDNASDDGTAQALRAFPHVRVLRNPRNLGFARATNRAAAAAEGELLVLLNNDTEVQAGWDLALRAELADPATGAVGLRLLYPDGTIQHAGLVFGPDHLPWHVYRGFPAEAREVMRRRTFRALTGACLGIRRHVWREVGGLDENFINCYEDIDLCLRIGERGLACVYRPDGVVIHHEGRTSGRSDRVSHSWLVLQERWSGRLPADEEAILAPDGWQAVRSGGGLTLRRLPAPQPVLRPSLLRDQAERLLLAGHVEAARGLLAEALADPAARRTGELRRALLELELRVGNLAAADRLAGQVRPTPRQGKELARLRSELAARMAALGFGLEG